jgi:outer membrane lipoprotein SlyB
MHTSVNANANGSRTTTTLVMLTACALLTLAGCAHRGARSPDAQPVLYPNAAYEQMGAQAARDATAVCVSRAQDAGLSPEEHDNAVGRGAAKGAAVGGTIGAVGSVVRGRGVEGALGAGARGAAVGAAAGAVAGSFRETPNMTYRHFVQRCLSERGLDVIGWQ